MKFTSKSLVLFILYDSKSKSAQVSCTGFSPKASEPHSAIVWTKYQLGSFYNVEQCTVRFTDDFRYYNSLDPESVYSEGNWHYNTEKPKLQKTHHKDKPTTALLIQCRTMHYNKSKPNSGQFNSSFHSTGLAVNKQSGSSVLHWIFF